MVEEVGGLQLQLVSWWTFAQADRWLADSGEGERWGGFYFAIHHLTAFGDQ